MDYFKLSQKVRNSVVQDGQGAGIKNKVAANALNYFGLDITSDFRSICMTSYL